MSERLMRLWIESRMYKLNTDEEHRQMALATLKEDFVKWVKGNIYQIDLLYKKFLWTS